MLIYRQAVTSLIDCLTYNVNLQTNRFRAGRAFDRQSQIDWLLTGNNQGPLIPTTDPTDTHHCAEPSGVLPPHVFLFAKLVP